MANPRVKKKKNKLGMRRTGFIIAFLAPTLLAFCMFYLYPIITVFITSFCKWDYTNIANPEFFSFEHLWDNYDYIFNKYPFFWEALRNSGSCSAGPCGNADSPGVFQKNERDQVCPQCLYYPEYDFYSCYGDNFLTIV